MEQEVYADLYVLINFGMDTICLMITATLLHCRVRRWRVTLAAALGGLYALFALLWGAVGWLGVLSDGVMALVLCAVAFAHRGTTLPRLLRLTGVQLLTSVILGGVMTVLYSALNRLSLPFDALQGDGLSVWTFALLTAVAGITTLQGGKWFGIAGKSEYVTIQATLLGKQVTLRALVDSGNLLRDPTGGKSVIVADRKKLSGILPDALLSATSPDRLAALLSDYGIAKQIRLIPTKTATGSAVLPAVIPSELTVTRGKETYPADYLVSVTSLGKNGDFDAIISLH